jgi:hypothetical protein
VGSRVERWVSALQRQHSDPMTMFIRHDQGTCSDGWFITMEEIQHPRANAFRQPIEATNLDHARPRLS